MSKTQNAYILRNELARINKRIETKILLGYSYTRDAKRHKMLLEALHGIQQKKTGGWFKMIFNPSFAMF